MFVDYFEEAIVAEEIRPNKCDRVFISIHFSSKARSPFSPLLTKIF